MLGELGELGLAVDPELLTLPWGALLAAFCGVLSGTAPLTLLAGVWAAELEGVLEGCTFFWVVTAGCGLGGVGHGIKAPVFAFMTGGHCGSASSLACSLSKLVQAVKPSKDEMVRVKASCFVIVSLFYAKANIPISNSIDLIWERLFNHWGCLFGLWLWQATSLNAIATVLSMIL